jgi:hypothetical protein
MGRKLFEEPISILKRLRKNVLFQGKNGKKFREKKTGLLCSK